MHSGLSDGADGVNAAFCDAIGVMSAMGGQSHHLTFQLNVVSALSSSVSSTNMISSTVCLLLADSKVSKVECFRILPQLSDVQRLCKLRVVKTCSQPNQWMNE